MTKNEALVSVIIPTYNVNNFIDKTIRTVLDQDYMNFEILVVDDESTDGTKEVIDDIAKIDKRIKVFHLDKHLGVSAARNYGMNNAQGKYIFFVDGDDEIENDFLSKLVAPMENDDMDMTIAGYSWGDMISHVFTYGQGKYSEVSKKEVYNSINTWGNKIGGYVWNKGFRADIIRDNNLRFDETLDLAEDLLFTAEYVLKADKFMYYSSTLYFKVPRSDSIIHSAGFTLKSKEKEIRQRIDEMGKTIK